MLPQTNKVLAILTTCVVLGATLFYVYVRSISFTNVIYTITFPTETIEIPSTRPIIIPSLLHTESALLKQHHLFLTYNSYTKTIQIHPEIGTLWPSDVEFNLPIKYSAFNLGLISIHTLPAPPTKTAQKNLEIIQTNYPLAHSLPYITDTMIVDYIAPRQLRIRTSEDHETSLNKFKAYLGSLVTQLDSHTYIFEPSE